MNGGKLRGKARRLARVVGNVRCVVVEVWGTRNVKTYLD